MKEDDRETCIICHKKMDWDDFGKAVHDHNPKGRFIVFKNKQELKGARMLFGGKSSDKSETKQTGD